MEFEPPEISTELLAQLLQVEPSTDVRIQYRPCRVTLKDGSILERVFVVEAAPYIQAWGVWPQEDRGKSSIPLGEVVAIESSQLRLPAALANEVYREGESGMGYCVYTIKLRSGERLACTTGNAVDFPPLPAGTGTADIVAVYPHQGRGSELERASPPDYWWCLYRLPGW